MQGEILVGTGITLDHNKKRLHFVYGEASAEIEIPDITETLTTKNFVLKEFKISDREFQSTKTEIQMSNSNQESFEVIDFTLKEIKK